jgi:hypothetical protein
VRFPVEIPKEQILDLLHQEGKADQAELASEELPDPVDPEGDSGLLSKYGLDPMELVGRLGDGASGL